LGKEKRSLFTRCQSFWGGGYYSLAFRVRKQTNPMKLLTGPSGVRRPASGVRRPPSCPRFVQRRSPLSNSTRGVPHGDGRQGGPRHVVATANQCGKTHEREREREREKAGGEQSFFLLSGSKESSSSLDRPRESWRRRGRARRARVRNPGGRAEES
jgi:hypothetical protein